MLFPLLILSFGLASRLRAGDNNKQGMHSLLQFCFLHSLCAVWSSENEVQSMLYLIRRDEA